MLEFRLIYYVILVAYRSRAHSISTENKRTLVVITSVQGDSKLRRSRGGSWGERRGQNWENVIDLYFLLLFKLTLNCGCRESIYRRCNCLEKDKSYLILNYEIHTVNCYHRTHVRNYDPADYRPRLAMLAANGDYRYWTGDWSRLGW